MINLSQGTIEKIEKDGYKVTGVITQLDEETVEITELPIRQWTQSYKETLEAWVIGSDKTPALVKVGLEFQFVFPQTNIDPMECLRITRNTILIEQCTLLSH